ncbi:MAG: general secretion pathway protein GspK [Desulfobacteraceae bacterium]|nr:MAG: general secretion pathway protein GspK [Desulfobacteraceae bacterium]
MQKDDFLKPIKWHDDPKSAAIGARKSNDARHASGWPRRQRKQPQHGYRSLGNLPARFDERGIAVVLALATMLMVVTAALEFHLNQRRSMIHAAMLRDRATLAQMGASAIHLGMAMLIKDRLETESDSLQEDWADAQTVAAALAEIPFEDGKLDLKITDELGKIQINALVQFPGGQQMVNSQRQIWERFGANLLSLLESSEEAGKDDMDSDPLMILNCIKDWLDSGDDDATTGLSGAESDYYQSLDPPYASKNGPFDHLSEVALVKGITPEIFFGAGGVAGLQQYITVYGAEKAADEKFTFAGKVNINTAELPVLAALLPLESADFASLLVEYREATSGSLYTNDVTRIDWYKNVPGLAGLEIDPGVVSVSSHVFRLTATASLNNVRVVTTAVVERVKPLETDPWQCKILNWKTE